MSATTTTPRKIKGLVYLQKGDLEDLEDAVDKHLKCGFEPFGTVVPFAYQKYDESRGVTKTVYSYIQAMIHFSK